MFQQWWESMSSLSRDWEALTIPIHCRSGWESSMDRSKLSHSGTGGSFEWKVYEGLLYSLI